MVIIKTLKKSKNGLYLLQCDNAIYEVTENTVIKLSLLSNDVKCKDVADDIIFWNDYYQIYDKCLKLYSKKLMSEFDFRAVVVKHTSNETIIEMIIEELKQKSIINDLKFKEHFINSYLHNVSYSSAKITRMLNDKQIEVSEKDLTLLIDSDFEKATKVVEKVLRTTKGKSQMELINKCKTKLISSMYNSEVIEEVCSGIEYDERSAVLLTYKKLSKRYDDKTVIKKLLSKGYNYNLIISIKEELNE